MQIKSKAFLSVLATAFCSTLFLVLRYAKVSPIFGSCFSFFSISDILMPLSGTVGLSFIGLMLFIRMGARLLLTHVPLSYAVYHIPGALASLYWVKGANGVAFLVPLASIGLFLAHPIGWQAAPYCLYWFIPLMLFFVPRKGIFLRAMSSTFIAHSAGSVIFLYTMPQALSPLAWIELIPVVAIERFVFALSMTCVYYVGAFMKNVLSYRLRMYLLKEESAL